MLSSRREELQVSAEMLNQMWLLAVAPIERLFLLAIAHGANDQNLTDPSINYLAWKTGLGRTTVTGLLSKFKKLGVLIETGDFSEGGSKIYRLTLGTLPCKIAWQRTRAPSTTPGDLHSTPRDPAECTTGSRVEAESRSPDDREYAGSAGTNEQGSLFQTRTTEGAKLVPVNLDPRIEEGELPYPSERTALIHEAFVWFVQNAGKTKAYELTTKRRQMAERRWNEIARSLSGSSKEEIVSECTTRFKKALKGLIENPFMRKGRYLDWEQVFNSQEKFQKRIEWHEETPLKCRSNEHGPIRESAQQQRLNNTIQNIRDVLGRGAAMASGSDIDRTGQKVRDPQTAHIVVAGQIKGVP